MPQPNDLIGPYHLLRSLGRGGFGEVWLAERRSALLAIPIALKIPHVGSTSPDAIRAEAELWLQASGHPNVVPVLDADVYDGLVVIASEYMAGGSLANWLRLHDGRSPDRDSTLRLTEGILSGLSHLHSAGIAHRDLKPDNILLQGGVPRLTDFGLARVLTTQNLSQRVSGSPHYMAPEAFAGAYSPASDLWSAGVILYEMLAGTLPFDGADIMQVIAAIREGRPAKLSEDVPRELRAVVERLLQQAPTDRFASAEEALAALRSYRSNSSSAADDPDPARRQPTATGGQPVDAGGWIVQLMGGVRLLRGGTAAADLPTRKSAALLARLAFEPGRELRREALMEMLWPELAIEQQRNNMSVELHRLRRRLALPGIPGRQVLAGVELLRVDPAYVQSDTSLMRGLVERAASADQPAERAALLKEAVSAYRPDLLADHDYDWIVSARESMDRLCLQAAERLITDLVAIGERDRAIEAARGLIDHDRFAEERHGLLIFALIQADRPCEALRHYEEMVELWRTEYGAPPGPKARKLGEEARRRCEAQPVQVAPLPAHNGPAVPQALLPILGREVQIDRLSNLLLDPNVRLVTLTGTGGGGKTRLAIEMAHRLTREFDGAVWFVPLVDVNDQSGVIDSLRSVLGLPSVPGTEPVDQICSALSAQSSLLVLDNFEHLLDLGAGLVDRLLERVPTLKILVTSRQSLQSPIETIYEVPPLPLPAPVASPSSKQAGNYEENACVRLFIQRATRARPDFALAASNSTAVIELCRRLDGIPLAIELAAAWARMLTPADMLAQLKSILVSRERGASSQHRSLDAVIGASFGRLTSELQQFMTNLSVFRGGWTAEAAREVCAEPNAILMLGDLQDASLILCYESGATMRYRMLEPINEYALERLTDRGGTVTVKQSHQRWFLDLARSAAEGLSGAEYANWLQCLDDDFANLSLSLAEAEPHERLLGATELRRYWIGRGRIVQGRALVENTLEHLHRLPDSEHGSVLLAAGILSWMNGDFTRAREHLHASLAVCQSHDDARGALKALANLANVESQQGDETAARRDHEASIVIARRLGDLRLLASILANNGTFCEHAGDTVMAQAYLEEALMLHNRLDDLPGKADVFINLADISEGQHRYNDALEYLAQCLEISERIGDYSRAPQALMLLASVAVAKKEHAGAVRVFAAAERACDLLGHGPISSEIDGCRSDVDHAIKQLPDHEVEDERRAGSEMTVSQAVDSAIFDARRWSTTQVNDK